jgi:hypothetical protein
MRFCRDCGLSIGETATFCATCGAVAPVDAPVADAATPESAASERPACRLCGREEPAVDAAGACPDCRAAIALFVAAEPRESLAVTLATSDAGPAGQRLTIANAIYSALADDDTCEHCRALDGRETTDVAVAATWAPNPHCGNPAGCRCLVFFEHESLAADEQQQFVDYAADHGLQVTAPAVAAFHDEQRRRRQQIDRHLEEVAGLLRDARPLERSSPQRAVALYRKAVDGLLACGEAPLDERRVRRDLPLAFNRLTLVLQVMGRGAEALDEFDRAASLGLFARDDCGRKSDREALSNRGRRLRERLKTPVPA